MHPLLHRGSRALLKIYFFCYASRAQSPNPGDMPNKKPTTKSFRLNAVIDGHLIADRVLLSPRPTPGIMTEVARFEAERLLVHLVRQEIEAGRLG
jgi:hypothetical protein